MALDKIINELRENTEHIGHLEKNLFLHLYGTYLILRDQMKKPEYLCLAGLMHSIYETEYFKFDTPYTREYVKSLVGDRTENLIYQFCSSNPRIDCLISNSSNWPDEVYADLLDIELANMQEQGYYNNQVKILETIRKNLK
jgi:hypothetical protein